MRDSESVTLSALTLTQTQIPSLELLYREVHRGHVLLRFAQLGLGRVGRAPQVLNFFVFCLVSGLALGQGEGEGEG